MSRSLRAVDVIVLGMTVFGAMALLKPLGVEHRLTAWAISMAWTCSAARRLMAWRRQSCPDHRPSFDSVSAAFLLFALFLWASWPVLDSLNVTALMHQHKFPKVIQQAGVALILFGVVRPLWRARQVTPAASPESLMEGVGVLLVTASPLLAALVACGLAMALATQRPSFLRPGSFAFMSRRGHPLADRPAILPLG